ncbi:sarcalumenin [Sabethes cyaneus]|uniref:sarcalumenin n=1 Tax=Sabethes cyaneus TaxID=53552 RepID=UPI00237E0AE0|nr:sarcalumenin [Sabethes cyaneus]
MARLSVWVLLGLAVFALSVNDFRVNAEAPTEYECRPYIEKALQDLKTESVSSKEQEETIEEPSSTESPIDVTSQEEEENTAAEETSLEEDVAASPEELTPSEEVQEALFDDDQPEEPEEPEEASQEDEQDIEAELVNEEESEADEGNEETASEEDVKQDAEEYEPITDSAQEEENEEVSAETEPEEDDQAEAGETEQESAEVVAEVVSEEVVSGEDVETVITETSQEEENEAQASEELKQDISEEVEEEIETTASDADEDASAEDTETVISAEDDETVDETKTAESEEIAESLEIENIVTEEISEEVVEKAEAQPAEIETDSTEEQKEQPESAEESEPLPEEDLLLEYEIPTNLRDTSHIYELLNINEEAAEKEKALNKVADVILRDLKKIYDTAIKPLEALYKYRDLSNRHFGDPEIFSKPLILFMGPWSGGKSTILNYLTQNEYTPNSVRTGAEPSPAYFNILMHGDEPEVLDGTQLAADWTFSGLQKFGQGLLDRLRGQKLPNKLLERVNIVEIPGILEVRKQVSQYFPFNDACQWFIDRADIIFLVYDPSKLDVGPETEAILDQLKGREYQTRILLNKADQVKPEELLRVQGALIWNISPLMSSAQPPVMYTVSLWSNPFETGAPVRLLQAQERFMLLDLSQAIEKRIENKIASARRFAVRVRNHAKMVDCYLTTYYNHKTLFANKKHISDQIIGNPQQYHIYEGLSTLTNISRYDLPDPEVYRDFFQLNPLYEFKKLSETCTYFRGCPINKLDIAIAYDLPELVGKYKKMSEAALDKLNVPSPTTDFVRGKSSS